MRKSRGAFIGTSALACAAALLGIAAPAFADPVVQSRSDPADSPGLTAADLRAITWSHDAGSATLTVELRDQDATGQRVLVWADSDADGKADLVVRIERDTKATANVAVETVSAPKA